ncbi:MAG: phosphoribosylformylglycinamidine synthase [Chitinivibrionales bacterium]|nr:phosphoribosylformylglycinamidine synthase [Chitinivibrionales bacterium]MBD3395483.1 phosphoribosylformylglycinamidine synthase [Chitinivibrionales bacterium]
MPQRIYVGMAPQTRDAQGEKTRSRIVSDLGIGTINSVRVATVYTLNADLTADELAAAAQGPLSDPIVQAYTINSTFCDDFSWMVEVAFLPGVTDNVARTAREAIEILLPRDLGGRFSVHTGTQYFFQGKILRKHIERIASQILANHLINSIAIYSRDEWLAVHTQEFPAPLVTDDSEISPYREVDLHVDDSVLMRISRDGMLALSLDEMHAIQAYYDRPDVQKERSAAGLPENPTNVELEVLAQTWSEHCKHKIFNASITYHDNDRDPQTISSLFACYIRQATKTIREIKGKHDICLSVFKDNAGAIRFNDQWAVAFKVETHNSPSALDPYGGALTGIVGVNRDPFGTGLGGRLIANTDVFCFASPFYEKPVPPRILHPKRVLEGVREGVEHGGNKSGIPTVNGTIVFDDRFLGKPLVYCGTLGLIPMEINGRKGYEKKAEQGDHILMVGGRIGKDGIHGATFSSEPLHEGSPATAVQIGDPITQKRMTDFLLRARDRGLYNSITDNGAGGLSSSVGEMAQDTGGAVVHLDRAPLKYHGLEPWEIFVSEAQERMTVAVPPEKVQTFLDLAREWSVEATDLGEFNDSGSLTLTYEGATVARLSMEFLHDGLPQMHLTAKWVTPVERRQGALQSDSLKEDLLALLRRLNICSKEYVVRQYDHEVQGGSVVKPLCGARNDGPSDAAVIRPLLDSFEGLAVANGIAPRYSDIDTYAMTTSVVDEAVRNAVCAGGDPGHIAGLDNFCWCDPVPGDDNPDAERKLAQLVRANQALHDMCIHYGVPLVSGKDSMKNDYHIGDTRISIPPTVLFSVVAKVPDVRKAVTMDCKSAGNYLYLLGTTYREFGATEYAALKGIDETTVPFVHKPAIAAKTYAMIHKAILSGFARACHDVSDGGLGVALAEMCFAGELGAEVDLAGVPQEGCTTETELLFSESPCRILVEVSPEHALNVESLFAYLPCARIGQVTRGDSITFRGLEGATVLSVSRVDAKGAWKSTLNF